MFKHDDHLSKSTKELLLLSDEKLIEWYQECEKSKAIRNKFIEVLYRRYSEPVLLNAIKWVKDLDNFIAIAEDARADIFMKQMEAIDKIADIRNIKAWLYTITKHHCLKIIANTKKMKATFPSLEQLANEVCIIEEQQSRANLVDDKFKKIMPLILELDKIKQQIIVMRFNRKMKIEQIALQLNMKSTTVRGKLQSAIKYLRSK